MNNSTKEQITIFRSLFQGREDVFAIQWKSGKRIGYMPAYSYDPYMYRLHKRNGGTFKNYKDKTYLQLNDYQIEKHINGTQVVGIYPLLKDNTSWFIVADFDKKDWEEQCKISINFLNQKGINA